MTGESYSDKGPLQKDSGGGLSALLNVEYESRSVADTHRLAAELAPLLMPGDVLCLEGELGAGKTHFVKGLAAALSIDPKTVHSPTFTLIHEYSGNNMPLYHFDFYRIRDSREAVDIGVEEYFYGDGISCIEWPGRVASLLPADALWLRIEVVSATFRKMTLSRSEE